ncbi:uncharacterized protein LOC126568312 [Anopheles maculipalpis]|uniref:uncharacterized protein LOC126568312 n=1 Tax=Anopheles maculipalpis TaxID=1496333 RepID=UPI002159B384|nr:uncharacterized protein LOC126568312 [Anopheles maculipalpis]
MPLTSSDDRIEEQSCNPDRATPQKAKEMERRHRRNEDLARFILTRSSLYLHRFNKAVSEIAARYRLQEIAQAIFASLQQYPILALAVAIAIFTLTLPFLVFVFFTMTTAVVAFTGFIMIEGALIMAASVMLVSLLIGVFLVMAILGLIFLTGCLGISRAYECVTRFKVDDLREYLRDN